MANETEKLRHRVHDLFNRVIGNEFRIKSLEDTDTEKRLRNLESDSRLAKWQLALVGVIAGLVASGIVEVLVRHF